MKKYYTKKEIIEKSGISESTFKRQLRKIKKHPTFSSYIETRRVEYPSINKGYQDVLFIREDLMYDFFGITDIKLTNIELTKKQLVKCNETLKDFVCLIPRYLEVKDNDELYDMFLSRNRNPLFDLTATKFWETGLMSNGAKVNGVKVVKDHYVPRKIAMGYIMEELSVNPEMSLTDFVLLCKKYASTVCLSEDEHSLITIRAKNTGRCNYEFYSECGIIIEGMDELVGNL